MKLSNNITSLEALTAQINACLLCPLFQSRTLAVPGEGNAKAKIFFIGEAPGKKEDEIGKPFIGQAGKILEELFTSIHLRREDVFITSIVKCRPPSNRAPHPKEIEACHSYLEKQLQLINPVSIVTLGNHALAQFFPQYTVSQVHGQILFFGNKMVIPLYHPAAVLYRRKLKETMFADFKQVRRILVRE